MQGLYVDRRFRLRSWGFAKDPGGTLQELVAPLLDLVGVDVEVLSQFDQGLPALDRGNSHPIVGKTISQIVF